MMSGNRENATLAVQLSRFYATNGDSNAGLTWEGSECRAV